MEEVGYVEMQLSQPSNPLRQALGCGAADTAGTALGRLVDLMTAVTPKPAVRSLPWLE